MDYNFSLKNIHKKINEFSNNSTVKRVFKEKSALKELRKLDSILQVILYSFIALSIRYRVRIILSLVFYMFYPIFSIYIKKVLKN